MFIVSLSLANIKIMHTNTLFKKTYTFVFLTVSRSLHLLLSLYLCLTVSLSRRLSIAFCLSFKLFVSPCLRSKKYFRRWRTENLKSLILNYDYLKQFWTNINPLTRIWKFEICQGSEVLHFSRFLKEKHFLSWILLFGWNLSLKCD